MPVLSEFWNLLYPLPTYFFIYDDGLAATHRESSLPGEYAISSSGLRSSPGYSENPCSSDCCLLTVRSASHSYVCRNARWRFRPPCISATLNERRRKLCDKFPPDYAASQRLVKASFYEYPIRVSTEGGYANPNKLLTIRLRIMQCSRHILSRSQVERKQKPYATNNFYEVRFHYSVTSGIFQSLGVRSFLRYRFQVSGTFERLRTAGSL